MERKANARGWQRRLPGQAVTVAVRQGETPLTYGVVSNISEAGACVLTDTNFPFNTKLDLTLSFYRRVELFTLAARIAWTRDDPRGAGIELGLEFKELSERDRERLRTVLSTGDFPLPPGSTPPRSDAQGS